MSPMGFEPTIPAGKWPQTYATGTATSLPYPSLIRGTLYNLTICNYESYVMSTLRNTIDIVKRISIFLTAKNKPVSELHS